MSICILSATSRTCLFQSEKERCTFIFPRAIGSSTLLMTILQLLLHWSCCTVLIYRLFYDVGIAGRMKLGFLDGFILELLAFLAFKIYPPLLSPHCPRSFDHVEITNRCWNFPPPLSSTSISSLANPHHIFPPFSTSPSTFCH